MNVGKSGCATGTLNGTTTICFWLFDRLLSRCKLPISPVGGEGDSIFIRCAMDNGMIEFDVDTTDS